MGFFGDIIGPKKREVAIPDGFSLTLLMACLDLNTCSKAGAIVTLWMQPEAENDAFIIAHFDGKAFIQCNLMQELATEDGPIQLWTTGGGTVHLTGRWGYAEEGGGEEEEHDGEFSEDEMQEGEEGWDEEEEEDDEEDADTRIDRAIREEEAAKAAAKRDKNKRIEEYLGAPVGNKRSRPEPASVEPSPFEEPAAILKSPFKGIADVKKSPFEEPAIVLKSPFPPARALESDEGEWEMIGPTPTSDAGLAAAVKGNVAAVNAAVKIIENLTKPAHVPAAVTEKVVLEVPEEAVVVVKKKAKRGQKVDQNDKQEKLERRAAKAAEDAELNHYDALVAPVNIHNKLGVEHSKQRGVWKVKPVNGEGMLVAQPKQVAHPSGILVTDYIIGAGKEPRGGTRVGITYEGMFPDGTIFDKNVKRAKPLFFRKGAGEVVRGLDHGLEGMHVGGSREIVVPSALGYVL